MVVLGLFKHIGVNSSPRALEAQLLGYARLVSRALGCGVIRRDFTLFDLPHRLLQGCGFRGCQFGAFSCIKLRLSFAFQCTNASEFWTSVRSVGVRGVRVRASVMIPPAGLPAIPGGALIRPKEGISLFPSRKNSERSSRRVALLLILQVNGMYVYCMPKGGWLLGLAGGAYVPQAAPDASCFVATAENKICHPFQASSSYDV